MKKLKLTFTFVINFLLVNAQGNWTELNALFAPQPYSQLPRERFEPAGFIIKDKVYYATGHNNDADGYFNDMHDFNLSTNLWESTISFPGSPRQNAVGATLNGNGFITMGYDDNTAYSDSWEFDSTTLSWSPRAAFPGPLRHYQFSFIVNNRLYVGGGRNAFSQQYYDDLWEYDETSDIWTQKAPIPHAASRIFGFGTANKGFIVGGTDSVSAFLNTCYMYDPAADSWTTADTFPSTWVVNSFSDSAYGYVMDGNVTYRMDPATLSWTSLSSSPQFTYGAVIQKYGSKFFLLGSRRGVDSYEPVTDDWDTLYNNLSNPLYGKAIV